MSSEAVPDDVEVLGLRLVFLHQHPDQVRHLQTNQPGVCCRLAERSVNLVHFLHYLHSNDPGKVLPQYSPVKREAPTAPINGNYIAILGIQKGICHVLENESKFVMS